MSLTGQVTLNELSPELRSIIESGLGRDTTQQVISNGALKILTISIVAQEDNQKVFNIPEDVNYNKNKHAYVLFVNTVLFSSDRYTINDTGIITLGESETGLTSGSKLKLILLWVESTEQGGNSAVENITKEQLDQALRNEIESKLSLTNIANDLVTVDDGKVLDARQGKILDDKINELSNQITWKPDAWKTEDSLPSEYPSKSTTIFLSGANTFNGVANCIVRTVCNFHNTCTQFIDGGYDMMPLCYRQSTSEGKWSDWKAYATVEQIESLSSAALVKVETFWASGDLNTANKINKWYDIGDSTDIQNLPLQHCNNSALYVYGQTQDCFTQILITSSGRIFKRSYIQWELNQQWTEWDELATTTKTNVLLTPNPEYNIAENRSCIINNIFHISCTVTKTDGSNFAPKQLHRVATYPSSIRRSYQALSLGMTYGDARTEDKNICFATQQEVSRVYIDGVIVL